MLTRTLGIVSGAAVLTLGFHAIETAAAAGNNPAGAFLVAFDMIFRLAGLGSALTGLAIALTVRTR